MSESPCPICGRGFRNVSAHAAAKHPKHHLFPDGKAVLRRDLDDEPSIADRMIDAQFQHAMGDPVEDQWLLDSIL